MKREVSKLTELKRRKNITKWAGIFFVVSAIYQTIKGDIGYFFVDSILAIIMGLAYNKQNTEYNKIRSRTKQ